MSQPLDLRAMQERWSVLAVATTVEAQIQLAISALVDLRAVMGELQAARLVLRGIQKSRVCCFDALNDDPCCEFCKVSAVLSRVTDREDG